MVVLLVATTAITFFWAIRKRKRRSILERTLFAYRSLTGYVDLPLNSNAVKEADYVEFSVKMKQAGPPELQRLMVAIPDYDVFVNNIPTEDMRAWFLRKPPTCLFEKRCEKFPFMMAVDGEKKKVYWEDPRRTEGMSYSSNGVERTYVKKTREKLPLALSDLKKISNGDIVVRGTPGSSALAYYVYVNMDMDDVTIDTICSMVESQHMQSVDTLRSWMKKAKDLQLKLRVVQFDGKSLTIYARENYR
ncbi:MAG: hypothetical protein CL450_07430 [Acidimicrobiaceae bacterium]|nr:hypothetical protein [Acidimicrobiaceae bacterium]